MGVNVCIHYRNKIYQLISEKNTTLSELLAQTDIPEKSIVIFSGGLDNSNHTPLVDVTKTLEDYNMWFLEKGYVAELSVFNETDNYDKELYSMYINANKN